jgi:ABC-type antimicrobial peptide transport system permease subunit
VALLLAGVGVYGLMAYSIAQRRREIGVRMALGAQVSDILRLVLRQGFGPVVIGVAFGILGAFAMTRVMSGLLYGVSATDPITFGIVCITLMSTALLAIYIPARRAGRIDLLEVLRSE